ncbi:hypothetical protein HRI97_02720 [Treponema socranskii subsp. buccale]|uniref:hypothetical protein n=1 Tax=Treponema socranskii TaxID=53419 RepID=UPI0020A2DE6A|nr:hypothetical protein [Treponema socranskii]UTD02056.1 hypothetical protein HRI97_02720 [Treponema socranskii subsp. buccale]
MKKLLILFCITICVCAVGFTEDDTTQVVMPKTIYVGDRAELSYTFRSAVDFFADMNDSILSRKIPLKSLPFETDTDDYTILDASLERNGLLYTFRLFFIPWNTGSIDFPMFDISAAVYGGAAAPFIIDVQSVEVSSILQDQDEAQLRASMGPLLLPGTMYALYFAALLSVILLIVIFRLVVKRESVRDAYKTWKLLRLYAKNAKELYRSLKRLERAGQKIDDAEFCTELQQLIRRYLDFRFGYRFSAVSSPAIMDTFEKIMADAMSEKTQSGAMSLAAVLRRTDYVRYARGSIDSKKEPAEEFAADLKADERSSLIRIVRDAVERFEGDN